MKQKTYKRLLKIGRLCFKKPTIYLPREFDENAPSIFLSNHAKNYGPVITITRFPVKFRPWCHSGVVHYNESFEYIRDGFFRERLKLNIKTAGFFANMIARPLLSLVNMSNPIPSYHDIPRSMISIKMGIASLIKRENQLMFSNTPLIKNKDFNPDFNFMKGYLLVVRKAIEKGVIPKIYPVSINKHKSTISIGEPITPNTNNDWKIEKNRIHEQIINEVKYGYMYPNRDLFKSTENAV